MGSAEQCEAGVQPHARQQYLVPHQADRGTLSPGKLADFVVLPADPTETDPWKLLTMEVTATYVGGKRVSP